MVYPDRAAAGRALGTALDNLRGTRPLVLGLPRGGVPVAAAVAEAIDGELDVLLVRKLGLPRHPELAMGALGENDVLVLNDDVVARGRVSETAFAEVERAERAELARRRALLRDGDPVSMRDRTVVIVDDGMATGATVAAACRVARAQEPARLIVAMPVSAPEALPRVQPECDELVCLWAPPDLGGVGGAYHDFHQLTDDEVTDLLFSSARRPRRGD
ncbi:phosphoribosyltransferase [Nocardia caishijiensis]|uniref:Phosphoribosyl transferase n=1 Tax=Nocardia caishijiensis TaxID=184756 RepID=A0ABQ6YK87_9NOCA|nr:phosphoribosyltransferase family protein [Nocardia caishijiensis]KAF0846209.1 putative phosphoribosyl transferase [Nocardia caishijiensis]